MLGPRGLTDSAYAGSSPAWRTHEPAETAAIGLIDHPLVLPVVAPPQEPETPVIDYFAAEAPAAPEPPAAAPAPVEDPAPTIELNTIPLAPPAPAPAEEPEPVGLPMMAPPVFGGPGPDSGARPRARYGPRAGRAGAARARAGRGRRDGTCTRARPGARGALCADAAAAERLQRRRSPHGR